MQKLWRWASQKGAIRAETPPRACLTAKLGQAYRTISISSSVKRFFPLRNYLRAICDVAEDLASFLAHYSRRLERDFNFDSRHYTFNDDRTFRRFIRRIEKCKITRGPFRIFM